MKLFAKRSCRLLACALAAAQLLSAAAGAAFSNGFSYSYPVGEGLTYTRTEGKNSAGVQRQRADLSAEYRRTAHHGIC